ncbi:MAG TPA: molybdopterin-synthase adenylyltransferase MoeB [Gemmatimonadaceae bacterium]
MSRTVSAAPRTAASSPLTKEEMQRYGRHLQLPEMGAKGQARLKSARVLLVGVGGLGSPAALYLAAAGVGTIGVVDPDRVDLSNLQRQVLHGTPDIGRPKSESAEERIRSINPHVEVELFDTRLSSQNALEVMESFDVVIDGSDNFPTRYLVNDAAVILGIPDVYGSVHRFEGQVSVFATAAGPCYRCLFRDPPPAGLIPDCAQAGVLGVLPGLIGTLQATEALKLLLAIGEPLAGKLLLVDSLSMKFRTIEIQRDPDCPTCGANRTNALIDYEQLCASQVEDHASHAGNGENVARVMPAELSERLSKGEVIDLIDVREPYEWDQDRLASARLIPLGEIASAVDAIRDDRPTVLYCKSGNRSLQAARYLASAGKPNVATLVGGIDRWRAEVDPQPFSD